MNRCKWMALMGVLLSVAANAAQPVVSNVRASQRSGTKLVDIYYDVSDADGHQQTVQVYVSADSGFTFRIPAVTFTGAVGSNVTPGVNKHIVWDAGRDWNGQFVDSTKVRVVANDSTVPILPFNMVYVPPGPFQMGDNMMEVGDDARPVHVVQVDGFFMDKFEVSGTLWVDVRTWAEANGYRSVLPIGSSGNHPIRDLNWYCCMIWCNARSEKEGLTPVYYTDGAQTEVCRTGLTISNACVKWTANGYRLPTEAEWEKASRGGLLGKRYPWGDNVDSSMASYGRGDGPTPCGYYNGSQTPAGPDMANGYGLYDMAGNVWEWCWDYYDGIYYGLPASQENPKGPEVNTGSRVMRGGTWAGNTAMLRCANRKANDPTTQGNGGWDNNNLGFGFRCVRVR